MDRHAQKQLLLTRIAYERIELRREMAQLREAASVSSLLRTALGGNWFGGAGASGSGWLVPALSLLRRYRVVATLFGAVAPALRGKGRWRRVVRLAVLGAAGWFGWRAVRNRKS